VLQQKQGMLLLQAQEYVDSYQKDVYRNYERKQNTK